ncbi:MAG: hypothetical protein CMH57_02680 [Myxococcales bacterium]|nr:hypothetical protein [Myxococcales bacterium]
MVQLMRGEALQVEMAEYGVVTCGLWQAALSVEVDGLEEGSASALREQLRRAVYNYNRFVGDVWS